MKIDQLITAYIQKSLEIGDLHSLDAVYVTNQLLHLYKKSDYVKETNSKYLPYTRLEIVDELIRYAVNTNLIKNTQTEKDILEAQIMNLVTPQPSIVNKNFWKKHENNPEDATEYFFEMSQLNNYIKTREIKKNIAFLYDSVFGEIQITINLSKPEKDPKKIASEANSTQQTDYPKNALVVENEGFAGNTQHAARSNHRIVRMDLNGEPWGYQYSPYAYYNEHSIFLAINHQPMKVESRALSNLIEIIKIFPHYFVGSNAGLPIVGGSILSQDHYQGGHHYFPIQSAPYIYKFTIKDISDVEAGIIHWPMSTIRLRSKDDKKLLDAANIIMDEWREYTDQDVGIYAYTGHTPHNAITPIARKNGELYELDMVLRNNRTTEEFPDGLFHPYPNVQHIKKENIGLIEVMGLAILPPRLKYELKEVEEFLLGERTTVNEIHQKWAEQIQQKNLEINENNVQGIIEKGVGEVFVEVLKNAGVFKLNDEGEQAFKRFIQNKLI